MIKVLMASLVVISTNMFAGTLVCSGKVDTVAYHGNDKLMVKLSSMNTPVFFCNPNTQWSVAGAEGRVMNSETCKAVLSMFLAAKSSGTQISKIHFDGNNVPASCSEFESWNDVFIRYVNY